MVPGYHMNTWAALEEDARKNAADWLHKNGLADLADNIETKENTDHELKGWFAMCLIPDERIQKEWKY